MLSKGRILVALVTLAVIVMACAPAAAPAPTPTAAPAAAPTKAPDATKPAAAAPTAAPATPTPKPATLKFGSIQSVSDAGIYVAIEKGYFKEQGITMEVENFRAPQDTIAPLATGQIDMVNLGMTISILTAADRGVPIKVVAGTSQYQKGWDNSWVILRKDLADSGKVKTPADLKGMKVAAPSPGALGEQVMQLTIDRGGLKAGDIDLSIIPFADQAAALSNKAIAAGWTIEPFITREVQEGFGIKWIPTSEFFGGRAQGAIIAFGANLSNDQDLARRWMVAYLKGARDYMKAFTTKEGRQQVVDALIKYTTVKDAKLYDVMEMSYVDPNGGLDRKSVDAQNQWFVDKGLYTGKRTFNDIMDLSFADYAAQKLGKQ